MKKIIFVRHAKSSWEYDVSDKDRPLKERGINDAQLVSQQFATLHIKIDYAFSSPANRALHTAMLFLRTLKYNFDDFKVSNKLYDFSGDSVLGFLKEMDNKLQTILVFGHNYAFTSLVNTLGDRYIENVPTSGLTEMNFDVNKMGRN